MSFLLHPWRCTDSQALKKIINSYAAGRSAADASLLSLGLRPAKRTLSTSESRPESSLSALPSLDRSQSIDLDPLPPETEPPAPSRTGSLAGESNERGKSFKAHRDVFFFTLQRELEKVSQSEASTDSDQHLLPHQRTRPPPPPPHPPHQSQTPAPSAIQLQPRTQRRLGRGLWTTWSPSRCRMELARRGMAPV